MSNNKKNGNQLWCSICQITLGSDAEYVLHEFSKKHCDNLIRVVKNKPIISKKKDANKTPPASTEKSVSTNQVPQHTYPTPGVITKYGYFVSGSTSTADNGYASKSYDYNYDPYLQKLAENPYKEKPEPVNDITTEPAIQTTNITSFSRKKKKKKIRTCQICNVLLTTVPQYEAHMKSPQHIWKLKMSGSGVSAHFVKASSDLHTTDVVAENEGEEESGTNIEQTTIQPKPTTTPFGSLFCDDCELMLNSDQQYNAHINGKTHKQTVQRKTEIAAKKEKKQTPSSQSLYCFSCKLTMISLTQYNDHKFGKKHKIRCRQLMKEGITIPPDERVPSLPIPANLLSKPPVYPEMYEKFVIEKQKLTEDKKTISENTHSVDPISGMYHCNKCNLKFNTSSKYEIHLKTQEHKSNDTITKECKHCNLFFVNSSEFNEHISKFHLDNNSKTQKDTVEEKKQEFVKPSVVFHRPQKTNNEKIIEVEKESCIVSEGSKNVHVRSEPENITCNICSVSFTIQSQFIAHLISESHAKKIHEIKKNGTSNNDILKILFQDKSQVKVDKFGRYYCLTCDVTSNNQSEYEQHLSCVVHKYATKEYEKKRSVELFESTDPDENGRYNCKLCNEIQINLIAYNQHLHTVTHNNAVRLERDKRKEVRRKLMQQRWCVRGFKRNTGWYKNEEKNPGVRTKIGGVATDLNTGETASVPNLEPLEPKIDPVKNVEIGITKNIDKNIRKNYGRPIKRRRMDEFQCFESPQPLMQTEFPRRWNPVPPSRFGPFPPRFPPILGGQRPWGPLQGRGPLPFPCQPWQRPHQWF